MTIIRGKSVVTGIILVLLVGSSLVSCDKSDSKPASTAKPEKILLDTYSAEDSRRKQVIQLDSDTVYILSSSFRRLDGEQLLIEQGTLIKVDPVGNIGFTIEPGGVLIANGTRENPVVFTSRDIVGSQSKNWGGVTITGKSVDNAQGRNGDLTDFSGSLSFVRIEFASLRLNAVGSRTLLENIQVSYANPDFASGLGGNSFSITGGSFDARNLFSYACGGPADFFITNGYRGKMQNLLAYRHPFFGKAETGNHPYLGGLVVQNNPFDALAEPITEPHISNLTVIGPDGQAGSSPDYADTTKESAALIAINSGSYKIRNSVLMGFPHSAWYLGDFNSAYAVHYEIAVIGNSVFHSSNEARMFFIKDFVYPPYSLNDFRNYALSPKFNNRILFTRDAFQFTDLYKYEEGLLPLPALSSPVFTGASFQDSYFQVPFFEVVDHVGAIGKNNWLANWTNLIPLKTRYNLPE